MEETFVKIKKISLCSILGFLKFCPEEMRWVSPRPPRCQTCKTSEDRSKCWYGCMLETGEIVEAGVTRIKRKPVYFASDWRNKKGETK